MKRREFLNSALPAGLAVTGALCCGGSGLAGMGWAIYKLNATRAKHAEDDNLRAEDSRLKAARAAHARLERQRADLARELYVKATPLFVSKQPGELNDLPSEAQANIRQWFDSKCLRVEALVRELLSENFAVRFKSLPDEQTRAQLLLAAFYGRCCSENEIDNVVSRELVRVGSGLDKNWKEFCASAAEHWSVIVDKYPSHDDVSDLGRRVEKNTTESVAQCIRLAAAQLQSRPTLVQSIDAIGASAIGLMKQTDVRLVVSEFAREFVGNPYALAFGVPVFLLQAFQQFLIQLAGWISNPAPDLQKALSAEVARLGNRVADDACGEIKDRITSLHRWQDQALLSACRQEAVRLI